MSKATLSKALNSYGRLEELEDPIPLMTALRQVDRIEFGWSSPIRFLSYCLSESFPSTSPQADTDKTAVERIPSEAEDCCGISTLVLREAHIVDPMASGYPTFPRLNPSNIANHGSLELRQGLSQNTSLKELHISQILSTIQSTAISTGLASGASKKQLRVLNCKFRFALRIFVLFDHLIIPDPNLISPLSIILPTQ